MNKYRELLMDYMLDKRNIVMEHTGIELMDDEDWGDLAELPIEKVKFALSKLSASGSGSCPWCLLLTDYDDHVGLVDCDSCTYGARHGLCTDDRDSRFQIIMHRIDNHTAFFDEMCVLVANTQTEYKKIFNGEY